MLYAVYVMLFPVFWRPVGFSTYIFGGDPLFPPTRARVSRARKRWRKSGSRTSTQKRGGDTTGSDKGEPQRAQTDQPDPQLIKHKRDEKKSYEIFLCLDDFRCGHQKNLNKLDQTCRDPYLISNKYQNVLELLGN